MNNFVARAMLPVLNRINSVETNGINYYNIRFNSGNEELNGRYFDIH